MNEITYKTPKRVDTVSAPEIDARLKEFLSQDVDCLTIDMSDTVYISSVGLRVMLSTQKAINKKKGSMVLQHVCAQVKEVFDITGFSGFLTIED